MIRHLFILVCLVLVLLAMGCGNKGPLYLPQDAAEPARDATGQQDEKDD